MKFAIYVRTSTSDQNTDNQTIHLVEYAKRMNWEYDIFEEQVSTRKTRPIKEVVLQSIRDGKYDGVLIYKLDRWARSLTELVINVDEITGKGKEFVVATQPIDTTNAAGKLFLQILAAFAEFEREIISERTKAGLERARAQGKTLGRPRKNRTPDNRGGFTI